MAQFERKFESAKQEWETPLELFAPLQAEFKFDLDVCADAANAKCPRFWTQENDGLVVEWFGNCWMNPPYRQVGKWVKKAYEEAQAGRATVVCLVPSRTNTNWWHDYCMKGEVRFIRGRPKFGGADHGLPQPLAIVVFRSVRAL